MNPIFHVLTEFKFEIGHAMTSSQQLQGAVEDLSHAADQALFSFQKMGVGLVAQMGLGSGGVLGTLYEAIQASEKFNATQRKLANVFLSNQDKIKGGPVSFLEAMEASNTIMSEINKKAKEFALPASALTNTVTAIAPALFNAGVAGPNLENAITMSRGLLKSAPTLGVDASMVQGQLLDLVMGRGSAGDTLSQRLMNETTAFRDILGPNAGHGKSGGHGSSSPLAAFNALPAAKRVEVLNKALLQFGSNTEILTANAQSLTQQIQVLKDQFVGMYSILKPIGDSLAAFLAPALERFNQMIKTHGAEIGKQLGSLLGKVLGSPETLFANLFQLKSLKRDLTSTSHVFSMAGLAGTIGAGLKFLGVTSRFAAPWVSILAGALTVFYDIWNRTPSVLSKIFMFTAGITALMALFYFVPVVGQIVAVATALTALFQLFSRAEGIAKVQDALELPRVLEDTSRLMNALSVTMGRLLKPFTDLFNAFAEQLAWMFRITSWADVMNNAIFKVVMFFTFLESVFIGLMDSIQTFMNYFTSDQMLKDPMGLFKAMRDSFSTSADKVIDENLASLTDPNKGAVANQITNIAEVNINNAFKEQMEPDRIAFTLVDQLKKVAQNPVSNPGRSMAAAGVSR